VKTIDLRRDTITLPTERMRERAFGARLGDSVYGEDPDHDELESIAAERLGKEAALFVPSGTMGNLISLLAHTRPGNEIILEENAHILISETGGAAFVGGLVTRGVPCAHAEYGPTGCPDPDRVREAVRSRDIHYPETGLICIESPHHRWGGVVPPLELFGRVRGVADRADVPVHLDGARLYNAAAHLGVDMRDIAGYADSVMVSLSKGMGAPVGSVVAGTADFIERAVRFRKMLGGGMRQTGWLAACGIEAFSNENMRLIEIDNRNAALLARGLQGLRCLVVDLARTHTNYVVARAESRAARDRILADLGERGILAAALGESSIRLVASRQVNREDIEYVIEQVGEILG
jgi:threonine aldolase